MDFETFKKENQAFIDGIINDIAQTLENIRRIDKVELQYVIRRSEGPIRNIFMKVIEQHFLEDLEKKIGKKIELLLKCKGNCKSRWKNEWNNASETRRLHTITHILNSIAYQKGLLKIKIASPLFMQLK
jgi:hypothetical protein